MPELATGNPRTFRVGRRVDQPSMDRVSHYGLVGNVEWYHGLGHGCIQNYMGGLSCRRDTKRITFRACKKEKVRKDQRSHRMLNSATYQRQSDKIDRGPQGKEK